MNTLKTIVVAAVVAVIAAAGTFAFLPTRTEVITKLGSSGNYVASPVFTFGDVRAYAGRQELRQASTTICAIQSPAATSTLRFANVKVNIGSSTALILDIAQATTQYATTTKIGTTYNIAAGAQAFVQASTSPAAGATTVFAPLTWLVVKAQGGVTAGDFATAAGSAGFVPTGSCTATWEEAY